MKSGKPTAFRIVDILLEDDDENYDDLIYKIARKATVAAKLQRLSELTGEDPSFGYAISTYDQSFIEDNATYRGIELTSETWSVLNDDIRVIERNAENILRKNGIRCQNHGHGDNDLVGNAWMDMVAMMPDAIMVPDRKVMNVLELMYKWDGNISTTSGNMSDLIDGDKIYSGVSEIGKQVLDVRISFYDTENAHLNEWADTWYDLENIWPQVDNVNEDKHYYDFNRLIGNPPPSGVFVKYVEGVPIFSAKCPGCKKVHGTFRTYQEASGNRQCKFCTRDYVDIVFKARETGNYKKFLKKPHDKRKH